MADYSFINKMKKTLPLLFAAVFLSTASCFADRVPQQREAAVEKSSPPTMLALAGGALVVLGLMRRKQTSP